jgi:hypothetical protein
VFIYNFNTVLNDLTGSSTSLITEIDNCPLPPPPTNKEIEDIISNMKNSKTPGDDGIQMKLISNLPVNGFNILLQILQNTWTKNQVPVEWIKTIQIPIPKIKKPKTTDDFRRISLCSSGYKIYSIWLLLKLENMLDELPS